MKPLDDEKKELMWKEIAGAMVAMSEPKEGEKTARQIAEMINYNRTTGTLRRKLNRLVDENILGKRKILSDEKITNVYFPLTEASYEELLDILIE
jgi:predicted transcriptional regulator